MGTDDAPVTDKDSIHLTKELHQTTSQFNAGAAQPISQHTVQNTMHSIDTIINPTSFAALHLRQRTLP